MFSHVNTAMVVQETPVTLQRPTDETVPNQLLFEILNKQVLSLCLTVEDLADVISGGRLLQTRAASRQMLTSGRVTGISGNCDVLEPRGIKTAPLQWFACDMKIRIPTVQNSARIFKN